MKKQNRIAALGAAAAIMLGFASCADQNSSTANTELTMKPGTYYLNGDTAQRAIILDTTAQTLQFTNCDIQAIASAMHERAMFSSEEGYQTVVDSSIRILSEPILYHNVDQSINPNKDIYIYVDDIMNGMMSFDYVSDAQGTALVFGTNNVTEYILVETAS